MAVLCGHAHLGQGHERLTSRSLYRILLFSRSQKQHSLGGKDFPEEVWVQILPRENDRLKQNVLYNKVFLPFEGICTF